MNPNKKRTMSKFYYGVNEFCKKVIQITDDSNTFVEVMDKELNAYCKGIFNLHHWNACRTINRKIHIAIDLVSRFPPALSKLYSACKIMLDYLENNNQDGEKRKKLCGDVFKTFVKSRGHISTAHMAFVVPYRDLHDYIEQFAKRIKKDLIPCHIHFASLMQMSMRWALLLKTLVGYKLYPDWKPLNSAMAAAKYIATDTDDTMHREILRLQSKQIWRLQKKWRIISDDTLSSCSHFRLALPVLEYGNGYKIPKIILLFDKCVVHCEPTIPYFKSIKNNKTLREFLQTDPANLLSIPMKLVNSFRLDGVKFSAQYLYDTPEKQANVKLFYPKKDAFYKFKIGNQNKINFSEYLKIYRQDQKIKVGADSAKRLLRDKVKEISKLRLNKRRKKAKQSLRAAAAVVKMGVRFRDADDELTPDIDIRSTLHKPAPVGTDSAKRILHDKVKEISKLRLNKRRKKAKQSLRAAAAAVKMGVRVRDADDELTPDIDTRSTLHKPP